jgi:hypothetical protein
VQKDYRVLKASAREVLQAYLEAVSRGDDNLAFWRACLIERMGMLNDALRDSAGLARADSDDSQRGGGSF